MGGFYKKPIVLVVHCVDTEGPIGGNVRRNADGTAEFMSEWKEIKRTLHDITNEDFRQKNKDSTGESYKYNWFIMDFTGFRTNPKERIQEYNNTYDNIKSLNTSIDSFHWHYHHPPSSGVGDQWSDDWNSSQEYINILGNRIMHRQDFPEVFRAGGTIEDNKCSLWLEDNLMIDYSNRVSHRSQPTDNIFDFNWHSAPPHWGYYRPSKDNFLDIGKMRRYVVRCVDLRSRLHELQQWQCDEAFAYAKYAQKPIILSYFSHDHRDMRDETNYAISLINKSYKKYGIDFKYCDAKEALQVAANIKSREVEIEFKRVEDKLEIFFTDYIYQKNPFVYTLDKNDNLSYHKLEVEPLIGCKYVSRCILPIYENIRKVGVACTSTAGDKTVKVIEL